VRWNVLKGRAAIIGAHGSGKSTLLEYLVPLLGQVLLRRDAEGRSMLHNVERSGQAGLQIVWLQLRRTSPASMVIPWDELHPSRLLVLDGYEQLRLWRRAALIARTALRGVKLLVTSHRITMLPTLCELSISAATARQIVSQLTAERTDFATIGDDEIRQQLVAHDGNMREVLMDFYDQFEEKRTLPSNNGASQS
jgi:hypothetical protein